MFEALQEVGQTLAESTISEDDISKILSIISQIISRLDESQLREIWQKTFQSGNATVRLFIHHDAIDLFTFTVDLHILYVFTIFGQQGLIRRLHRR